MPRLTSLPRWLSGRLSGSLVLALVVGCSGADPVGDTESTSGGSTSGGGSTSAGAESSTGDTSAGSSTSTGGSTSGESTSGSSGGTTSGGTTSGGTTGGTSGTTSGGTSGGTSGTSGGDTTTGGVMGLPDVGSLVVLGDSISDGGGQPPYYYDLLRADLDAKYGGIKYVNNAQSGSKTGALLGQAKGLPGALPGPVVVVVTSGGNDMKGALVQVISGTDGPVKAQVAMNIDAALGELLAPNRFGPGVEVFVFEGNIYDASDGEGNFSEGKCAFGQGLPPLPTDGYFDAWNAVVADAVGARGQEAVDMHGEFYGHGYNNPPNWYASDCTHPSMVGHDQLRRIFYTAITGEALP